MNGILFQIWRKNTWFHTFKFETFVTLDFNYEHFVFNKTLKKKFKKEKKALKIRGFSLH